LSRRKGGGWGFTITEPGEKGHIEKGDRYSVRGLEEKKKRTTGARKGNFNTVANLEGGHAGERGALYAEKKGKGTIATRRRRAKRGGKGGSEREDDATYDDLRWGLEKYRGLRPEGETCPFGKKGGSVARGGGTGNVKRIKEGGETQIARTTKASSHRRSKRRKETAT